ncbi:biotin/lipoyl-binding protein [Vibrio cholerae]|nr:biotin/lipoyl-binding protein [Vibrio cholerae]
MLAFRVPGQLQTIDVLAGQEVKKGEVLARLTLTNMRC